MGHYAAVIDAVTISGGGRICFFDFSCQCLKPMRKDFPFPSAFPRANSLSNSPCAHCPRLRLYICALTDAIPTENKARLVEVTCNVHHTHTPYIMNAGIFYNSKDPPFRIRTTGCRYSIPLDRSLWTDDFGIASVPMACT